MPGHQASEPRRPHGAHAGLRCSLGQAGPYRLANRNAFLFTYGYSTTTGFLSTLTYPKSTSSVALNLQYAYAYGLLQSVTDTTDTAATCGSTCTLWTATAMDGFGHATGEKLGNGIVTARTYDAVTSWLNKATAGVGGGATLLNQSYLQDKNGNVTQRQDGVQSLTENFSYDADNRVTCATTASGCSTPTFVYDGAAAGPGNITSQTGVGTYTYNAPGTARPHAVVSITGTVNGITNPQFAYDLNGNMTNRASTSQNIYWYTYNYPASITGTDATGTEEVQFNYGPDRQRWKQTYTGPSVSENTYYVGGLMDVVYSGGVTDYRHYIYAGKEPVAVYSRTNASGITMRYLLQDHLGSIAAITSNAGSLVVDESFSAFGQRRDPTTWTVPATTGALNTIAGISRQGYTFQTWLGQSMGLNHMNGRVQDAILGRFLSPDPHITDPSNAQSYNRYSYVNDNPLSFSDPSGFIWEDPDPQVPYDSSLATPAYASDGSGGGNDSSPFRDFFTVSYYVGGHYEAVAGGSSVGDADSGFVITGHNQWVVDYFPYNLFDPGNSTLSSGGSTSNQNQVKSPTKVQNPPAQSNPCLAPPLDTGSNRPYDPSDPSTHVYSVVTPAGLLSAAQQQQLADLWRNGPNAAPGIAPNTPDNTNVLLANLPGTPNTNWIYLTPVPSGLGWVNVTQPGHYFYSGTVTNTVQTLGPITYLSSVGTGDTSRWLQNDVFGSAFFQASQAEAIAALYGAPRVRIGSAGGCNGRH